MVDPTTDSSPSADGCPFFWKPPPEWDGLTHVERARRAARFHQRFRASRRKIYRETIPGIEAVVADLRAAVDAGTGDRVELDAMVRYLAALKLEWAYVQAADAAHAALVDPVRQRIARQQRRERQAAKGQT